MCRLQHQYGWRRHARKIRALRYDMDNRYYPQDSFSRILGPDSAQLDSEVVGCSCETRVLASVAGI